MTIAAVHLSRRLPRLAQANVLDGWWADMAAVQVNALGIAKMAVLRTAHVATPAASLLANGLCFATLRMAVLAAVLNWLLFRKCNELAVLVWVLHHALWRIELVGSCRLDTDG